MAFGSASITLPSMVMASGFSRRVRSSVGGAAGVAERTGGLRYCDFFGFGKLDSSSQKTLCMMAARWLRPARSIRAASHLHEA
jgi:hypothetical protein